MEEISQKSAANLFKLPIQSDPVCQKLYLILKL